MTEVPSSTKHIPAERLFKVAGHDDHKLSSSEFDHLKGCGVCVDRFAQFVHQSIKEAGDKDHHP
jgi:hypothetical protein